MNRNIYTLLVGMVSLGLFLTFFTQPSNAQVDSERFDFANSQGVEERLTPNGVNVLGDNIDPNTGSITFEHVDVSLPGNSALEVVLRRRNSQGSSANAVEQAAFGDWFLDIPTMSYTYLRPFELEGAGNFAGPAGQISNIPTPRPEISPHFCTPLLDGVYTIPYEDGTPELTDQVELAPEVFSRGLVVNIPGRYNNQSQSSQTSSNPWRGACQEQANSDLHYIVTAPNGDQYKFTRYIFREAEIFDTGLTQFFFNGDPVDAEIGGIPVPREHVVFLITEVTDVNGNWVRYEYTNDERAELTRIHANDGRDIRIFYKTSPAPSISNSRLVDRVEVNGRTWRYEYNLNNFLSHVTLPDGRQWVFGNGSGITAMSGDVPYHFECVGGGPSEQSFSLKHPDGMTGSFTLRETRHLKGDHQPAGPFTPVPASFNIPANIRCEGSLIRPRNWPLYRVMSVKTKTLSGPDYPAATWRYSYSGFTGGTIPTTKWTEITDPLGRVSRYTYHRYGPYEGLMDRMERRASAGGSVIESTNYTYIPGGDPGIDTGLVYGFEFNNYRSAAMNKARRLIKEVTVNRDGDTYRTRTAYDFETNAPTPHFALPTQTERLAVPSGTSRVEETTYQHITTGGNWIIGLPKTVTRNGKLFDEVSYDSKGRPVEMKQFGVRQATLTYHETGSQAGQVHTYRDAINRTTTVTNYHRGTPQLVTRPDGTSFARSVDDNGWITSETNPRGLTLNYTYNNVGWLTGIERFSIWADSVITYSNLGNGLVRTETRGDIRTTETYDGLLRPIHTKADDLRNLSNTVYTTMEYDALSREIFTSFPSYSSNPTTGVETVYDALNRVIETRENVAPFATTRTQYLSGARMRVTDPSGAVTTSHYRRFGSPDGGEMTRLVQPQGVTTEMGYDIFGNLLTARQHGTSNGFAVDQTQRYFYDDRLRVCRHSVPETRDVVYHYDDANQMVAQVPGRVPGTSCPGIENFANSTAIIHYTHDALGRVTTIDYPLNTPDIHHTYDANSNIVRTQRGTTDWSYGYTSSDLLRRETLTIDGRTFETIRGYNGTGNPTSITYPDGRRVTLAPDGFGRANRVFGPGGERYANNVDYHPNGALSRVDYLNGQRLTQSQNARQLLTGIDVRRGGAVAVNLDYAHDSRGLITAIDDGVNAAWDRTFAYDDLGRLIFASGPWSGGNQAHYLYDALGNIRRKQEGAHVVELEYNAINRLSRARESNNNGTSFGAWSNYSYNGFGNVRNNGKVSFGYDRAYQPTSMNGTGPDGTGFTGNFTYDGNLKRVKQVMGGKTIYSVYGQGGGLIYREDVTNNKKTNYMPFGIRLEDGVPAYTHADHLGSPVAGTDETGAVLWRERYTPFGQKLINPSANKDNTGYTSHIDDASSGLTYMQARYYDPNIGRFLVNDPVSFSASGFNPAYFNRYAYVANDPINAIDPDGRSKKSVLKQGAKFLRTKADQRRIKNARARGRRAALKQERQQLRDTGRSDSELSPGRQEELLETGNLKNMDGHHNPSISSANNVDEAVEIAENPDAIRFMEKSDHQKLHSDAGGTQVPIGGGDVITGALTAAAVVLETIALIPDPVSVLTDDNRDNMGCGDFSGCGQNDEN